MPTRAELVERFTASEIGELNDVVTSEDFSEEAKEVAREQLLARGIAGPPMRGAAHLGVARVAEKGSAAGALSPAMEVMRSISAVLSGITVIIFGVISVVAGALGGGVAGVESMAAGVGVSFAGAMFIWRRAFLRWTAIAAFVFGYALLLLNASSAEDWYGVVRWSPAVILGTTTMLLIRTRTEIALKAH